MVIAHPGQDVELLCALNRSSDTTLKWMINHRGPYGLNSLYHGIASGHSATLYASNLIVKDIVMNDPRNNSYYYCVRVRGTSILNESDPTFLYVAGKY